jgi:hypothetical protein
MIPQQSRKLLSGLSSIRHIISASLLIGSVVLSISGTINGQLQAVRRVFIPNGTQFLNLHGASETYSAFSGGIDETGPFFQRLGTNGRSCATCHQPSDGMSVSALNVSLRFIQSQGLDPIFRPVDGSNCDHNVNLSTVSGRYAAYSLLRTRGLIRIAIAVPSSADYAVTRCRTLTRAMKPM